MIKYLGIAVCALFCSILLKDKSRSFALVIVVCGICLILYSVLGQIKSVVDKVNEIVVSVPQAGGYIKLMLKVLVVTLITQAVGDMCRDNGETALAGVAETAAKTAVIVMVMPLFEAVISIVSELVK